MDLTAEVEPLGIVPYPQDGYGRGTDQLAQPDDVELLSDGTMIVTDVDNNRIQYFSQAGELIRSITADDLGLEESEIIPTGVTKDSEGMYMLPLKVWGGSLDLDLILLLINSLVGPLQFLLMSITKWRMMAVS
jgi:sugar lactone lactonase YvrE